LRERAIENFNLVDVAVERLHTLGYSSDLEGGISGY
jgi:hypothetical protein